MGRDGVTVMDASKQKKEFVRPRIVRRREKLASIVQFATGGTAVNKTEAPNNSDDK
jgi:3-methyladenine DNA glycosylase Tag